MNKTIKIEINESYCLDQLINENEQISVDNPQIIEIKDHFIIGKKVGETTIFLNQTPYHIQVVKEHELDDCFDLSYGRFCDKNVLIIGDSVSAQATIGTDKTYSTLLQEAFHIKTLDNQAIGGTTLTYMFEGSHIDKEYHDNVNVKDGCMVVNSLNEKGVLKNYDYVFIAYGHNDQYFKVPLDEPHHEVVNDLSQVHSFKNSYRYIIQLLKKANPRVRIIILNCTYSEYDLVSPSPYGNAYTYANYRQASKEIAIEYHLKHIDPWDAMKPFFDFNTNHFYYKDSVHISKNGHEELFKFLITQ